MTHNEPPLKHLRIRRALLAALVVFTPALIIVGLITGFEPHEWMIAWAGASMGSFALVFYLFGISGCPMPREKGTPRKKGRR